MRILHLVHDSPYTDGLIETFEYFKVTSRFVVLSEGQTALRMVTRLSDVEIVDVKSGDYDELMSKMGQYDVVWLHYASRLKIDFVNHIPKSVKVFWSTWGGDYCQFLGRSFYAFRTLRFRSCQVHSPLKFWIKWFVQQVFSILHIDFVFWDSSSRSFFRRVDYFSCVLPSEEPYVRRLVGRRPLYCAFHADKPVEGEPQERYLNVDLSARRIWAGNSAIVTNNHFDLYCELAKSQYSDYEVYSPLSYGSEGLNEQIAAYGTQVIGSRFHPILNYMSWMDYAKLMASCSVFVFWHYRQQSVGNAIMALRMGGCVFLSRKSPLYTYLIKRGLLVFTLEDLKCRFIQSLKSFRCRQDQNRKLAMTILNWDEEKREIGETLCRLAHIVK